MSDFDNIYRINQAAPCWTVEHVIDCARDMIADCFDDSEMKKTCYEMNVYDVKLLINKIDELEEEIKALADESNKG